MTIYIAICIVIYVCIYVCVMSHESLVSGSASGTKPLHPTGWLVDWLNRVACQRQLLLGLCGSLHAYTHTHTHGHFLAYKLGGIQATQRKWVAAAAVIDIAAAGFILHNAVHLQRRTHTHTHRT